MARVFPLSFEEFIEGELDLSGNDEWERSVAEEFIRKVRAAGITFPDHESLLKLFYGLCKLEYEEEEFTPLGKMCIHKLTMALAFLCVVSKLLSEGEVEVRWSDEAE